MSSEHEVIRDLLADLLNEQRNTTAAISSLAVAIANAGQGSPAAKVEATKAIEKAAAPAPKTAKAAAAPAQKPAASVTPQEETAPEQVTAESPTEISYDDVAAIVIKYSKANGRPATVEALKPFGITSLTAAKPEQYVAIAKALTLEAVAA